jgi:hypothetical protein
MVADIRPLLGLVDALVEELAHVVAPAAHTEVYMRLFLKLPTI